MLKQRPQNKKVSIKVVERKGCDTYYYEHFRTRRGRRKKYFVEKGLLLPAEHHSAFFSRLRRLRIPIAPLYDAKSGRICYTAKDLSRGLKVKTINPYLATRVAKGLHKKSATVSDFWKLQSVRNLRSIAAGIARDLAILHSNGLHISLQRNVLEPWLLYFRGKNREKQGIASRAVIDVGAINEVSAIEDSTPDKVFHFFASNLEDALISFPEECHQIMKENYRRHCSLTALRRLTDNT